MASSFRTWNSSVGIPSPPLALFIVMLSKAHLASHSRMSGSRWVDCLCREDLFCTVLLCILPPFLNIFCFCSVHTISVLYWAHLCMKCSLGISNFLEEISSLSYSVVSFISLHWLLRKAFLSLLAILHSNGNIFPFLLCFLLLFFS